MCVCLYMSALKFFVLSACVMRIVIDETQIFINELDNRLVTPVDACISVILSQIIVLTSD